MDSSGFVTIISIADTAPTSLRQCLLKQKFDSKIVKSFGDAEKLRLKHKEMLTVVCFGESQDDALALIKRLLATATYHALPLLVVGEEADTLTPELAKVFPVVGALNVPANASQICAAIERLWADYLNRRATARAEADRRLSDQLDVGQRAPVPSVAGGVAVKERSLTDDYFSRLSALKLLGETVGGSFFGRTAKLANYVSMLDTKGIGLAEAYERSMHGADRWIQGHSLRVAYVSYSILSALGFTVEQVLSSTRAALWHPIAFRTNRRLARGSYRKSKNQEYRSKVSKAVRESATKVSYDFKAPTESLTVGLLSRIIEQNEVTFGSEEATQAYALYVADVIDRACCADGYFNPQKGYQLLNEVKKGAFNDIDPSVAVVAVKFLSEAIVGCPPKVAMPATILRAYRKRLAAGEIDQIKPNSNEKKVPISKLAPGMRLSRPLCTFDGKEVLEPSLKLDEDLIMRVWQLTAIRPLEAAIVQRDSIPATDV